MLRGGAAALVVLIAGLLTAIALVHFAVSEHPRATSEQTVTPTPRRSAAPPTRSTPTTARAGPRLVRRTATPILMYHEIAPAPADAPYPQLYVHPRRFRAHMAYLARHRYEVVTLQQVWDHWHGGARAPRKAAVVSFDDGSRGWYTAAYPALRAHGWVGTMNVTVNHLGRWDIPVRLVRRLVAAGWELDSHSLTHPDLTVLGKRELQQEVAGSRRRLRRLFGARVNFFCYPTGRYDAQVIAAVRRAGYLGATTTLYGVAVPTAPFALRRIRVEGSDDAASLGKKLQAG